MKEMKNHEDSGDTYEKCIQSEGELSAYEKLTYDLDHNPKLKKEIALGRRVGLYRLRGELGSGNFSSVKLAIHSLVKDKVAIKILDKTKMDAKTQKLLSQEIRIMEELQHPNVIRIYQVVETLAKLHLVMEYAAGGELFTKLSNEGKIPEVEAKCIFAQIIAALEHMHNKCIIHRDLKAENIFFASPYWIKVGDFGFSTFSQKNEVLNTFCGSPPYAAPELFRDEIYFGIFVDVWALGILLYFMVTGVLPFRAENVKKLKKCILENSYTIPPFVSSSCNFLIQNILQPIPQDRFSLVDLKKSDWLNDEDFPEPQVAYNKIPNLDMANSSEEEQETMKYLFNLGIKQEHFNQIKVGNSCRSSIVGTYRILLHRIQKRQLIREEPRKIPIVESKKTCATEQKPNNFISKLCTLL